MKQFLRTTCLQLACGTSVLCGDTHSQLNRKKHAQLLSFRKDKSCQSKGDAISAQKRGLYCLLLIARQKNSQTFQSSSCLVLKNSFHLERKIFILTASRSFYGLLPSKAIQMCYFYIDCVVGFSKKV